MEATGLTAHGIDICLIGTFPILALTFASFKHARKAGLASWAGLHRQTSFRHGSHEDKPRRGVDSIPDRGRHQNTSIHAICDFPTSPRRRRKRMRRDVCKHQKKQNSSPEWMMHSFPRCLLACLPAFLPCRNLGTLPTYPTYLPYLPTLPVQRVYEQQARLKLTTTCCPASTPNRPIVNNQPPNSITTTSTHLVAGQPKQCPRNGATSPKGARMLARDQAA
ncbi:hypothetical protein BKA81DRAFT_4168 [Phyllosticta paracitricarpa]|uniref:Uncharacterized protein n=2 Tax=Phyllosticta TaxID=121621 RepID=A0ABR1MN80_9PEZI